MTDPRDDYLWDPAASPDPELQALEGALAPLRAAARPLDAARLAAVRQRRFRVWWFVAAAAAVWFAVFFVRSLGVSPDVQRIAMGESPFTVVLDAGTLRLGLGDLVEVEVQPATELTFAHWRTEEARFSLRRGSIAVRVAPPPAVAPRFFCVDTPMGTVVDLGCRYELRVLPGGNEHVRVTEGAVEFAFAARTVFVPAGAECTVAAGRPATPRFTDTDPLLSDLLGKLETSPDLVDAAARVRVAERVAQACADGRDTLILWHLLLDVDPGVREVAEARLVELVGLPPGAAPTKTAPAHADAGLWLPYLRLGAWREPR